MEVEARDGQSVYLRGWGDYQRYSLKLTESALPGLGHLALRAWSPEALERRVAAIERRGLGDRLDRRRPRPRTRVPRSPIPDGHRFELYYESERYEPPEHLRPALKNVPQRYVGRGAAVKRLDHVNVLAADVRRTASSPQDVLGYRLYEQIVLDDGTEAGAWMSLSIAAHELIYVADHAGASGRLHHLAFFVDTREECLRAADLFLDADVPIEAAPSKHAVAQGLFLYGTSRAATASRSRPATHFVFDPDYEPVVWTQAERARGQAWGVKTIESFHTYGTPDIGRRAASDEPDRSPADVRQSAATSDDQRRRRDPRAGRELGRVARRRRLGAIRDRLARRRVR